MIRKKKFPTSLILTALFGVGIVGSYHFFTRQEKQLSLTHTPRIAQQPVQTVSLLPETKPTNTQADVQKMPNFVDPAAIATPAVVHIKSQYEAKTAPNAITNHPLDQLFREFFGDNFNFGPKEHKHQPLGVGSGVICTSDGYIITNHHVIDNAVHIEVILHDNRSYTAKLVGKDTCTDLALLKIEEKELPYLTIGNSDDLQVGEWVLAVGNPFSLTSTVTKGIVSAKARTIDLPKDNDSKRLSIQSFIQTDAAVNPGNSGGALVNMKGELVGINTAIYTPGTGAFTGYAFAIPSSLVKKVTNDLMQHGTVQRVLLGIMISELNASFAKEKGLKRVCGVYVASVQENSVGASAGLQQGDVIIAINDRKIKKIAELQEQISCYQPNDKIKLTFDRKGKEKTVSIILKKVEEETKLVHGNNTLEVEGAIFENIDQATQQQLNITGGVRIKVLKQGKWKAAGIKRGFILTAINKKSIKNLTQLSSILTDNKGVILVEGIYPTGVIGYYALNLRSG